MPDQFPLYMTDLDEFREDVNEGTLRGLQDESRRILLAMLPGGTSKSPSVIHGSYGDPWFRATSPEVPPGMVWDALKAIGGYFVGQVTEPIRGMMDAARKGEIDPSNTLLATMMGIGAGWKGGLPAGETGVGLLAGTKAKSHSLPSRTMDTMSDAIAIASPDGRMSKRAASGANERVRIALFGEKGLSAPSVVQPSKVESLLRQAKELRVLADRGMKPRAYRKKALELEEMAKKLMNE